MKNILLEVTKSKKKYPTKIIGVDMFLYLKDNHFLFLKFIS